MNKIFERIIEIEDQLNSLIEEVGLQIEPCPNNKEEIEQELITASKAVGRIYSLNVDNFEGYRNQQEQDKEEGY